MTHSETSKPTAERPGAVPPIAPDPNIEQEARATAHVHDSSSVAPSRAEQWSLPLHSPVMLSLIVFGLLAFGALGFMLVHVHSNAAHLRGANDAFPAYGFHAE
ncbi:MAG TPA: hypothetical protein VHV51_06200 [Polyangiaceae bacterium]|jgi:hypothetical protein|nr:hypothetical protein [Polyangiaceae bacterium]